MTITSAEESPEWWLKTEKEPVVVYVLRIDRPADETSNFWVCTSSVRAMSRLLAYVESNWPGTDDDVPDFEDMDADSAIDWFFDWNNDVHWTVNEMTLNKSCLSAKWG